MLEWFQSRKETYKQLTDVSARLETLERQFKNLALEWESTYDKLRGIAARIAKRAERLEGSVSGDSEEVVNDAPAAAPAGWSKHAYEVNEAILRRRAKQ